MWSLARSASGISCPHHQEEKVKSWGVRNMGDTAGAGLGGSRNVALAASAPPGHTVSMNLLPRPDLPQAPNCQLQTAKGALDRGRCGAETASLGNGTWSLCSCTWVGTASQGLPPLSTSQLLHREGEDGRLGTHALEAGSPSWLELHLAFVSRSC